MNVIDLVRLPARYKPWQPCHLGLVWDSLRSVAGDPRPHAVHLGAAIDWLCQAQDVRDGQPDAGGVSAGWSFEDGWLPSYPESTGYIIETMLAAAQVLQRPELVGRARRMIDWELSIQLPDGAFPGHFGEPGSRPVIFNTGQIMHGMVAGCTQLKRQDCLAAAVRAGHWLADQQDEDGCWRKYEHHETPHVYNTRATWPLLGTGLIAGDTRLVNAAKRNLDWALTQQTACGWFATNAFVPWKSPFTHTIAYAIRGFLESGVLLGEERYLNAALAAGRGIAAVQRADGWLAGTYKDGWVADAGYACLTGVAQMSLNWTRLAQATGAAELHANARSALAYLMTTQRLAHADPTVRGGIAGSAPIWGDYSRFEYPNGAAKFFADALMRGELLKQGRLGILNLHGGLSPEYRGADCTFWALYNGEPRKVGCTLHWIDAGIDSGGLVAHVSPKVLPDDDELKLFWRAVQTSAGVYAELLQRLAAGERFGQTQPHKGRLYQVNQRALTQERVVNRRLQDGLLRGLDLDVRVSWFPAVQASTERQPKSAQAAPSEVA